MGLPNQPATLTPEQIAELNQKLSTMCHDIRNCLSVVVAATELIRQKPELTERMIQRVSEQPTKISHAVDAFRAEFEKTFGIIRS